MTEVNERITALETKMVSVMGTLDKREDYQASVLKSLTIIEMKQDQALNYQKTCDAERAAYGIRLMTVENERAVEKGNRRLVWLQAVGLSGVASVIVSVITAYYLIKHG